MDENKLLKSALWYQKHGFSVIPAKPDKKPIIKWTPFQTQAADEQQIIEWWKKWPGANIGLITGKVSGVMAVDVDTAAGLEALMQFLPDQLKTPISRTPKGGYHYYFQYKEGLKNEVRAITGCDIRTDNGYVISPPSVGPNGKPYTWEAGIHEVAPAPMPEMLFDILQQASCQTSAPTRALKNDSIPYIVSKKTSTRGGSTENTVVSSRQVSSSVVIDFDLGSRDSSLFHIANCLVKGGMDEINTLKCLNILASQCSPPFSDKEVFEKFQSAKKRMGERENTLADDVREYVVSSNGVFLSSEVVNCLHLSSRVEKKNVSKILSRMVDEKIIERTGTRNGQFRKIDADVIQMDFLNAEAKTVDLWLPFGIHDMAELMPGNIAVIAGSPNSGKTGFLLNFIKNNMKNFELHYFNSEMGGGELQKRLSLFENITLTDWNFKAYERSSNFSDVIKPGPGKVNVIDFLEIHDNFYEVAGMLSDIHKKLRGAIAIVALQKNAGQDCGLGGFRSLEKPRLYLSMDHGSLKIVKAKNWKTSLNPNGKQLNFKVVQGCKFIKTSEWL